MNALRTDANDKYFYTKYEMLMTDQDEKDKLHALLLSNLNTACYASTTKAASNAKYRYRKYQRRWWKEYGELPKDVSFIFPYEKTGPKTRKTPVKKENDQCKHRYLSIVWSTSGPVLLGPYPTRNEAVMKRNSIRNTLMHKGELAKVELDMSRYNKMARDQKRINTSLDEET